MGSFKPQPGKTNTIIKHRHLRKIANLLRYVEFCIVLVMISRLSIQLPVAVKNSSEYFHGMVSPCFVFLLGNVIIITLFAQSGQFSAHSPARDNSEPDVYQEFLQNSINYKIQADKTENPKKQSIGGTEDIKQTQNIDGDGVKHQPKLSVRTENRIKGQRIDGCLIKYREKKSLKPSTKTEDRIKDQEIGGDRVTKTSNSLEVKDYRRCQSDIIRHVESEKPRHVLHRCGSENNRGSIEPAGREGVAKSSYPEDGMSNEEFRHTIEAFIARQQRLRRQEQCSKA